MTLLPKCLVSTTLSVSGDRKQTIITWIHIYHEYAYLHIFSNHTVEKHPLDNTSITPNAPPKWFYFKSQDTSYLPRCLSCSWPSDLDLCHYDFETAAPDTRHCATHSIIWTSSDLPSIRYEPLCVAKLLWPLTFQLKMSLKPNAQQKTQLNCDVQDVQLSWVTYPAVPRATRTRSSAVADRPCDASCHWIFC